MILYRSKLQNPNKMEVGFTANFKNLLSSGQYQFKGYLGRMPINANGRYNITFSKVKLILYYYYYMYNKSLTLIYTI